MTVPPTLRLIKPSDHDNDSIPFERRQAHRCRISGRVTALVVSGEGTGDCRRRICSLRLRNISRDGLGAVSQEPVEIGSRIVVFFPPEGAEHGFDHYGQVVRCEHGREGCDLGVEFDAEAGLSAG